MVGILAMRGLGSQARRARSRARVGRTV